METKEISLNKISTEAKAELRKEIMQELSAKKIREKLDNDMIMSELNNYNDDFKVFDYHEEFYSKKWNGEEWHFIDPNETPQRWHMKMAYRNIIKMYFKAMKIPMTYENVSMVTSKLLSPIKIDCSDTANIANSQQGA